jgi:ribosomal protein S18 acetylase RimI-like enzyme
MPIEIKPAEAADIPALATMRARVWQTEDFWTARIGNYLRGAHSPQHAQAARSMWVALHDNVVVGFVAGHLTSRFGCHGELQWINVHPQHRRKGIADRLTVTMLDWFHSRNAFRVCVNVEPGNSAARSLYAKHGAVSVNEYWMLWTDLRQMQLPPIGAND